GAAALVVVTVGRRPDHEIGADRIGFAAVVDHGRDTTVVVGAGRRAEHDIGRAALAGIGEDHDGGRTGDRRRLVIHDDDLLSAAALVVVTVGRRPDHEVGADRVGFAAVVDHGGNTAVVVGADRRAEVDVGRAELVG